MSLATGIVHLGIGAGPARARLRRSVQASSRPRPRAVTVRAAANDDEVSAAQWASALTDKPWDAPAQPWTAFLAVKGKQGFKEGFMLQDYASPAQMLNNGIALSLPSSPKDAARRFMCNAVHFRQNYLVLGALCLLLSAFPRPFEILLLASAVVTVASISSTIFDRIWVEVNKEFVFKYLPFETPRKLTGELVGNERSLFGVPRILFQAVGLIGTAFCISKTYATLPGLFIAALLYFIPTVFLHLLLRPIDLFGGGSWTEMANSVKRKAVLNSLGKAMAN